MSERRWTLDEIHQALTDTSYLQGRRSFLGALKALPEPESKDAKYHWATDEMEIVAYEADHCAQERGLSFGADAFLNVRFGFIEGAKWMARRHFERMKK